MGKKEKPDKKNDTDVGKLVDMTGKRFEVFCKKKDVGFLRGLDNLLKATYEQMIKVKNDLVSKLEGMDESDAETTKEYAEVKGLIVALYSKMKRVEDKVLYLKDLITKRGTI